MQKIDITSLKHTDQIMINDLSIELHNIEHFYWSKESGLVEFTTISGKSHEFLLK